MSGKKKLLDKPRQYCQKIGYTEHGLKIRNLKVGSVPILLIEEKPVVKVCNDL